MKIQYCIKKTDEGHKLAGILKSNLHVSGSFIKRMKRTSCYDVNGEIKHMDYRVCEGDVITVDLSDYESKSEVIPVPMKLEILFEDEYITVVNKPPHTPVHPSHNHPDDTLSNGLSFYMQEKGIDCETIRPVNRLDSDTSGIVVFANSAHVHHLMSNKNIEFKKKYIAVVEEITERHGIIDLPIRRKEESIIERIVSPDGKKSVTEYETLYTIDNRLSVLYIRLHTGRTHQIRVHMSAINHPVLGDSLYGKSSSLIDRQALHAFECSFVHPVTGKTINITAPIPKDISSIINT